MQTPKIGDMVHYVMDRGRSVGQCRPAVIVKIWSQGSPTTAVQLSVQTDFTNDFEKGAHGADGIYWATSVQQKDTDPVTPYSYHYPTSCPQRH